MVNALRTVADRTQGPILSLLKQRGIAYQSFYIVNMIKVTGDRNLMEELAARSDVARIDANPLVKTALPNPDGKVSADEAQGIEWNVARVKAPDVWALGLHRHRPGRSRRRHRRAVGPSGAEEPLSRLGWPEGRSRLQLARRGAAVVLSQLTRTVTALSPSARWWAMTETATRSAWLPAPNGLPAATWIRAATASRRGTPSASSS